MCRFRFCYSLFNNLIFYLNVFQVFFVVLFLIMVILIFFQVLLGVFFLIIVFLISFLVFFCVLILIMVILIIFLVFSGVFFLIMVFLVFNHFSLSPKFLSTQVATPALRTVALPRKVTGTAHRRTARVRDTLVTVLPLPPNLADTLSGGVTVASAGAAVRTTHRLLTERTLPAMVTRTLLDLLERAYRAGYPPISTAKQMWGLVTVFTSVPVAADTFTRDIAVAVQGVAAFSADRSRAECFRILQIWTIPALTVVPLPALLTADPARLITLIPLLTVLGGLRTGLDPNPVRSEGLERWH